VLPTADLQSFAHWQSTERLKPRTREDIAGAAPIDFDQRTTLPEVSLSLSRFRRLLEDALGSTAVRMRLGTILETSVLPDEHRIATQTSMLHRYCGSFPWSRSGCGGLLSSSPTSVSVYRVSPFLSLLMYSGIRQIDVMLSSY